MRFIGPVLLALALAACAGAKPFQPPVTGEIPEGPGLLSGKTGEFVLFRK